jgi:hypothetical protein
LPTGHLPSTQRAFSAWSDVGGLPCLLGSREATVVLAVLALLVPLLMLILVIALDVFEDRLFRPRPPPSWETDRPPNAD